MRRFNARVTSSAGYSVSSIRDIPTRLHQALLWALGRFDIEADIRNLMEEHREERARYKQELEASAAEIKQLLQKLGDEAVYQTIGHALTAWAHMEAGLVVIFGMLLRTESERAGLILYSIINFSSWLSLIDEFFTVDPLYAPLKPRWNKLNERLRELKDTRDRLAHQSADRETEDALGRTLRPSPMDLRQKSLKYKPMSARDITVFSEKVISLNEDLSNFIEEQMMKVLRSSQEKSV